MIRYLDLDTVVSINLEFGGPGAGVRDPDALAGAIELPSTGYEGQDYYPTVGLKAAALLRVLAGHQYFLDGNKRTGYLSAKAFLVLNGVLMRERSTVDTEVFVRAVAAEAITLELAEEWLVDGARGRF